MIHVIWSWLAPAWTWFTPDRVIAIATIVYAFVTIVMFFAIKSQAEAAHRQADLTEAAAKAAQRSADSLINLERPWILVRAGNSLLPYLTDRWYKPNGEPFTIDEALRGDYMVNMEYIIKNYGRSPGWMVYHWCKVEMKDAPDSMPERPDYKAKPTSFDGPDSRHMEPRRSFKNWIKIPFKDFIAMRKCEKFMYIYGYITYRDVWDQRHTTGFSLYYHFPGLGDPNLPGFYPEPEKYNYET